MEKFLKYSKKHYKKKKIALYIHYIVKIIKVLSNVVEMENFGMVIQVQKKKVNTKKCIAR